ncbi:MAG: hypothetical protein FWF31_00580 [Desulfobulbus sp.]|nr:hypothetical protein [Desulfobulbus sp.]
MKIESLAIREKTRSGARELARRDLHGRFLAMDQEGMLRHAGKQAFRSMGITSSAPAWSVSCMRNIATFRLYLYHVGIPLSCRAVRHPAPPSLSP